MFDGQNVLRLHMCLHPPPPVMLKQNLRPCRTFKKDTLLQRKHKEPKSQTYRGGAARRREYVAIEAAGELREIARRKKNLPCDGVFPFVCTCGRTCFHPHMFMYQLWLLNIINWQSAIIAASIS